MTHPCLLCWRDDAPQIICTSCHDFLDGARLSLPHPSPPSRKLPVFCQRPISHSPLFNAEKTCFNTLCVSVSLQHFTCSKYSLAADSCCHWPSIPACLSFFSFISKRFYSSSFLAEIFPHVSYVLLFSHHFPQPSFSPQPLTTATLSMGFVSFCLQRRVVTLLA